MLEAFALLALLSVTDPPGDAGVNLSAPTAAVFRQRGAFDVRTVTVADLPTLTLSVTVESLSRGFPEALLEFYLQDPDVSGTAALLRGFKAFLFLCVGGHQRRYVGRFAVVIDSHHREVATVGMAHDLVADVLRDHLDADFHRRAAGVVDRRQERHQFTHVNRLAEHHLVHRQRDHIAAGIAAGACIRHLIEKLEDVAAVHVAGKIGHVGRHQHGHAELVGLRIHGALKQK